MNANKEMRKVMDMLSGVFDADEGDWVTINGTHVLIGEGGEVKSGPSNLRGKSLPNAKSQKRSGGASNGSGSNSKLKSDIFKEATNNRKHTGASVKGANGEDPNEIPGYVGTRSLQELARKAIEKRGPEGMPSNYELDKIDSIAVFGPDKDDPKSAQLIVSYSARNKETGEVEEFEAHPYVKAYSGSKKNGGASKPSPTKNGR